MKISFNRFRGLGSLYVVGLVIIMLSSLLSVSEAGVWYVDDDSAASSPDGLTWGTAFTSIQDAIDAAVEAGPSEDNPAEVWVAGGTYTGSGYSVIYMAEYVNLYGGFTGDETRAGDRDWEAHPSVISGEGDEESRKCVQGADHSILDGFTIEKGNTNGPGGGIYCRSISPTIANCLFKGNFARDGGAIYSERANPLIVNCIFENNRCSDEGAGIYNIYSNPIIDNCLFYDNYSEEWGGCIQNYKSNVVIKSCHFLSNGAFYSGGAIYDFNSETTINNCIFDNNYVDTDSGNFGAGICIQSSTVSISHSIFTRNKAPKHAAIYKRSGLLLKISNCIFWGNSTKLNPTMCEVSHSCVQDGYEGEGNINENPLFWNWHDNDFRLHSSSPCLNSGAYLSNASTDIRGVSRPFGSGVDMGAFEMNEEDSDQDGLYDHFENSISNTNPQNDDTDDNGTSDGEDWFANKVIYVNKNSQAVSPDGSSWENAFPTIQPAIDLASIKIQGQVWVATGSYESNENPVMIMRQEAAIYGGFAGNETDLTQRHWETNPTVITNHSETAVFGESQSTLDGFTITGCQGNNGGGMYLNLCSPTITNCKFIYNTAMYGGGIYMKYSAPTIKNCLFSENRTTHGGAVYQADSTPVYTNCIMLKNRADIGGAIYHSGGDFSMNNCTLTNNLAVLGGGGLYNLSGSPSITNCIFWGNGNEIESKDFPNKDWMPVVSHSCITGGYPGQENIESNPLLWNSITGDIRLHPDSPCIDTGLSDGAPAVDFYHQQRPQGSGIDMGAIEMIGNDSDNDGLFDLFEETYSQTNPNLADSDQDGVIDGEQWLAPHRIYVDANSGSQNPDGSSWDLAFTDIQSAIDSCSIHDGGEVWVAEGSYTNDQYPYVRMRTGVNLYGGFGGTENSLDERDIESNVVTVGEGGSSIIVSSATNTILNGITITGGGMIIVSGKVVVSDCTFRENMINGGIKIYNASPQILDSRFYDNTKDSGGGVYIENGDPLLSGCYFDGNISKYGAGIYSKEAGPSIINCLFTRNVSTEKGSIYEYSSASLISHCTVINNTNELDQSAGICSTNSESEVSNSIIYRNQGDEIDGEISIRYSCVEDEIAGVGNTHDDPGFWNSESDDYRLHTKSPCLDKGIFIELGSTDTRGVPRPTGAGVDMGIFEMNESDSDNDGLYDEFERLYSGTDPNKYDTDGDGLSDGENWFALKVHYVNIDSQAINPDGLSWDTAYRDIQPAIEDCYNYGKDEIWVAKGKYTSKGDQVIRVSRDVGIYGGFNGNETQRIQRNWQENETIIDGEETRRCIFSENKSLLNGLIITKGFAEQGGGLFMKGTSHVISHCTFKENSAAIEGGGIYNESNSSSISDCQFINNTSNDGGGIFNLDADCSLVSCQFISNTAESNGGGMESLESSGSITNCQFIKNAANSYGGLFFEDSSFSIARTLFSENTAEKCSGMYVYLSSIKATNLIFYANTTTSYWGTILCNSSFLSLTNCTVAQNKSSHRGGMNVYGDGEQAIVSNSIFWGNTGAEISGEADVSNSCIAGSHTGIGITDSNPLFWNQATGDLRLHPDSPCINKGTEINAPAIDFYGSSRPHGRKVDIGAIEMVELDTDHDGLYDIFETGVSQTDPQDADSNGNGHSDGHDWLNPIWFVDVNSQASTPDGSSWEQAFCDIPSAYDAAIINGKGEIWVANGTYTGTEEQVITMQAGLQLYGGFSGSETQREQRNWSEFKTIISGEDQRRCVFGKSNSTIDGFCITQGSAKDGAGIYNYYSSSIIRNCFITNNVASAYGGGIYNFLYSAEILNCIIDDNRASSGGGIYNWFALPIISGCTITSNRSGSEGGGIYNACSSHLLENCHFSENTASNGNAIFNGNSHLRAFNCIFANSKDNSHATVIYNRYCYPRFINCTFANNPGEVMDGEGGDAFICNSIIWNSGFGFYYRPTIINSCVYGRYGEGNIATDPLFSDPDNGDYTLQRGSPCIDAGDLEYSPTTDITGMPRPQGGLVDMGAYETVIGGGVFFSN